MIRNTSTFFKLFSAQLFFTFSFLSLLLVGKFIFAATGELLWAGPQGSADFPATVIKQLLQKDHHSPHSALYRYYQSLMRKER
jgi:hypothetical protein